ncbi:hypothetical protein ACFQY9_12830 [Microvirga aerilata]|uniref:hypothetical protein n=1 Tax=Microvirga aerilata TaxID=670292 RepID=UPI0036291306
MQGAATAPRVNGTLDAAEVRLPQGTLQALNARVTMNPVEGTSPPDRFSFAIDANATGIQPADRALARAIGTTLAINSRGSFDLQGVASVETARIETSTARAGFTGRVGGSIIDGTLEAGIPALAPFSGIAGRLARFGFPDCTADRQSQPVRHCGGNRFKAAGPLHRDAGAGRSSGSHVHGCRNRAADSERLRVR